MKKVVDYGNVSCAIKELCKSQSVVAISIILYELLNGLICAYVSSTALVSVSIALTSWYFAKAVTRITSVGSCIKIYEQEGKSVEEISLAYSKAMKSSILTGLAAILLLFPMHIIVLLILSPDKSILIDSYIYLFGLAPYCILGNMRKVLEAKHTVMGDVHSVKVSEVIYNTVDILTSIVFLFIFKLGILSVGISDTIGAIAIIIYFMKCETKVKYVKNNLTLREFKIFIKLSEPDFIPTLLYSGVSGVVNYALMMQGVPYVALFAVADRVQMVFETTGSTAANVYRTLYAIYNSKENKKLLEDFKHKFNCITRWLTGITAALIFLVPFAAIKLFNFTLIPMSEAYILLLLYMTQFIFEYKFYIMKEQLNFYNLGKSYTLLLLVCSGVIPIVCSLISGYTLWISYTYSFIIGILICKLLLWRKSKVEGYVNG